MASILDEFDGLDDDDEIAFAELVHRYQGELESHINYADNNTDTTQAHVTFMNRVVGAASAFNIEPFHAWAVPARGRIFDEFDEFSLALERYLTSLKIRKSRRGKIYSVVLEPADKKRIHFLVAQIREALDTIDIEERKKNSLFKKLNAFAADVDKARTGFENAYLMGIDVANLAKKFGEAVKPVTELVNSINELMGSAKDKEPEQQQLPAPEEQKKLEPPRKQIEGPKANKDLDEEIPF